MGRGYTGSYCQQACGGSGQGQSLNDNMINSNAQRNEQLRSMTTPDNIPDDLKQRCYVQRDVMACRDIQNMRR